MRLEQLGAASRLQRERQLNVSSGQVVADQELTPLERGGDVPEVQVHLTLHVSLVDRVVDAENAPELEQPPLPTNGDPAAQPPPAPTPQLRPSAAAGLYVAGDGAQLFERTVSRLMEMHTEGYLAGRDKRAI